MKLEWNKVTWYSRLVAIFVFFGLIPVLAFRVGTEYEKTAIVFREVGAVGYPIEY